MWLLAYHTKHFTLNYNILTLESASGQLQNKSVKAAMLFAKSRVIV